MVGDGGVLRGATIGAGIWSGVQLEAWQSVENAEIVALCDQDRERLQEQASRFGIQHTFADAEPMLEEVQPDFVDICTRPPSHRPLIQLAASRGMPVLCQKPFCNGLEEASEVVELCRQANIKLMVNENFRWQPWYRKARELLEAGRLGRPFYANMRFRLRASLPQFRHRQEYFAQMPRWAVLEQGVHYLDTSRFLFGDPHFVFARLHRVSPYVRGEDVELVTLGYEDLTCLIDHSWASVPVPSLDRPADDRDPWDLAHPLEIDGTEGTLALAPDGSLHLYGDADHERWDFPRDARFQSCVATQQHFVDRLSSDGEFETDGRKTLRTLSLVEACYVSDAEQRPVKPEELNAGAA